MKPTKTQLRNTFPQVGRVHWIGVSPGTREPVRPVPSVVAAPGTGLEGDYHLSRKRQVSLIQAEHLPAMAALAGLDEVKPEQMRRNLVVQGINLLALINRRFRVGEVLLEGVDTCDPCHRVEENLGPGGYNASLGMGGLLADVIQGGTISLGDAVAVAEPLAADE